MNLFNDPSFRVIGLVLLVGLVGILLVLLVAHYEKKRHFWKYLIPGFLLLAGAYLFMLARATPEAWGAIGYMIMALIAFVASLPGILTAIILDIRRNKENSAGR